jgi:LlaJI restriction endonuclease
MNVYNDSKIHTLKILLKFLEKNFDLGKTESISYGFSDFQYVWEHMLRSVLSPTHTFSDMPVPAYREMSGKEIRKDQKGQRVDIFLYQPKLKQACVVDAKYYDGTSTDKAPGWPDLVKQFFYAKSLTAGALKHEINSVKNYFIFPGASTKASPDLAYVIDSSGSLDVEFPPIKCIHISPEEIIVHYVSSKPFQELREKLLS